MSNKEPLKQKPDLPEQPIPQELVMYEILAGAHVNRAEMNEKEVDFWVIEADEK